MIASFVKEDIIVENLEEYDYSNVEPYTEGIYDKIERTRIVEMVEQLEETFCNYLAMRNLQWAPPLERDSFIIKLRL
jgi:hypothetical protein